MKKLGVFCLWLVSIQFIFAQGREGKLPVLNNPFLPQNVVSEVQAKKQFSKAGTGINIYPFTDWFAGQLISDSLWKRGNALQSNHHIVFNAQDSLGNSYTGASGEADVLESNAFTYLPSSNSYLYLNYSTGSSISSNDSLVISFKSSGGTWIPIYTLNSNAAANQDLVVAISNSSNYTGVAFSFKLSVYTSYNSGNTETFLLHQITLSDHLKIPMYENFYASDSTHNLPSPFYWMKRTTTMAGDVETGKGNSNAVSFDALDEFGNVYNAANPGQLITTDVLTSHLINLLQFDPSDLVNLRFFVKAMPNAKPTDVFQLEYRNNAGVWVPMWNTTGIVTGNFLTYSQNINFGKYRSANFQFRLSLKCHNTSSDTLKFILAGVHVGRKTILPFLDDFSTSGIYPDQHKWTTTNTYINTRFPVKPPSINVATFDALDQYGNPYKNVQRYTDTLTSVAIDLSSLNPQDTNIWLSFWVQPKGLGDIPNSTDSLVLNFRTAATQTEAYRNVWSGARANYPTDTFTQILVRLDSSCFHDDFQFRFMNKCARLGNLDHWHVDYIRLDKLSKSDLTYYNDVTLSQAPGSLLTPYSSMPYSHFIANPNAYLMTSQQITADNMSAAAKPIRYAREVFDPSGSRIDSIGNPIGSVVQTVDITLGNLPVGLNTTPVGDSVIFTTRYTATSIASGDNNIFTNDSLTVPTIFSNYYAYDDGSAENGYAIMNVTGSAALKYTMPKSDSLYGVSIFFNQSITDVSTREFTLKVWRNINTNGNGTGEDIILELPFLTPVYSNKINCFHYIKFDQPIYLNSGNFYIGWNQTQIYALNIGCDENFQINGNRINPNGWVFLDDIGIWRQTETTGAVMMRPIIGKWIDPPVGLNQLLKPNKSAFSFYPNPASERIHLVPQDMIYSTIEIMDLMGKMMESFHDVKDEIQMPFLSEGIYLLKATQSNGTVSVKKILIRNN